MQIARRVVKRNRSAAGRALPRVPGGPTFPGMIRADRIRWPGHLALALALACGGADDADFRLEGARDDDGRIALPPSAGAPRADLPGGGPDTLRPVADSLAASPEEVDWRIEATGEAAMESPPAGRRRAPEEFDIQTVVDTYRRYYTELFHEMGSEVRGGSDPALERDAKRRVALDWGYVEVGAWSDMVGDMTRDQRIVLADRVAAANAELAGRLHSAAP